MTAAISSAVYKQGDGSEYSSGIGDEDAVLLHQGHTNKTLSVVLEDGIPQGTYDIRIEVWPRAHIGGPGYGTWQ